MNQDYLNSFVGMNLQEAEEKVVRDGYKFWSLQEGGITFSITRPDNLVELYYGTDNKVVRAYNQQVTDKKQ